MPKWAKTLFARWHVNKSEFKRPNASLWVRYKEMDLLSVRPQHHTHRTWWRINWRRQFFPSFSFPFFFLSPNSFYVHLLSYFVHDFLLLLLLCSRWEPKLSSAQHFMRRIWKEETKQNKSKTNTMSDWISVKNFFLSFIFRFYCCCCWCWSYFRLCKLHTFARSSWRILSSRFWEFPTMFSPEKIDFSNGEFREHDMGHTHTRHKNAETIFPFHPIRVRLSARSVRRVFTKQARTKYLSTCDPFDFSK